MDKAAEKTERTDAQRYVLAGTYGKGQLEKWPGPQKSICETMQHSMKR